MKKLCLLVVLLGIGSQRYFAQNSINPIIGYDKYKWGSSIEQVIPNFKNTVEIDQAIANEYDAGSRWFIQTNTDTEITERRFYFFKNELFRVDVNYENLSDSIFGLLIEKIELLYGKFDERKTERFNFGAGYGYTEKISYQRNFSPDLMIFVDFNKDYHYGNSESIRNSVRCTYMNFLYYERIRNERIRQRTSDIPL